MESIGTLAGGIAHDFNNLLNVILGYASVLKEPPVNPSLISANVDVIKETVNRGGALVRQLLALARKTETRFERLELNGLVKGLHSLLRQTFPKTIEVQLQLEGELPYLQGDPNQLHQAMLNLSLNARDAMPDGGILKLKTATVSGPDLRARFQEAGDGQYVQLTVADSGFGIDDGIKSRIFEPFFTTKPQGQGIGLGLSVVYGIVTGHSGFIDVTSEPGEGTAVDIYLPVAAESLPGVEGLSSADNGKQEAAGAGQRILL